MLYSGYNGPLATVNCDADGNGGEVGCLASFRHAGSRKLGRSRSRCFVVGPAG